MPVSVLIYEDNLTLSDSLAQFFADEEGFSVAGCFPQCDNVVQTMEETGADLIIMDIDMPGIGGIRGVQAAKNARPGIKIVMHTVFDNDERIFDSICAGADGYLLKSTSPARFIEALRNVMNGDAAMSPFVAKKVFQYFQNRKPENAKQFNLTTRETEILQMLAKGNTYKIIAEKCCISQNTVKTHLRSIYDKLHVNCGTEAVAKALSYRIVNIS